MKRNFVPVLFKTESQLEAEPAPFRPRVNPDTGPAHREGLFSYLKTGCTLRVYLIGWSDIWLNTQKTWQVIPA